MTGKSYRLSALLLLVLSITTLMASQSLAADKLLFKLLVNDGYATQEVPVYEQESGKIKAKKGLRTLYVNRASQTVSAKVTDKTDYYKETYKLDAPDEVDLGTSSKLKGSVITSDGKEKSFKIKLKKPKKPKITSVKFSEKSYTPGEDSLKITVKTVVQEEVTCEVEIYNSKGKRVFSETAGTGREEEFSLEWDGKASEKNKAGLTPGEYVPKGKYKIRAVVEYKNGEKTKKVKKSESVKVKTAKTKKEAEAAAAALPVFTKTWNWVVVLSGNKKVDYLAEVICQEILKPGMSEYSRVKAIYKWCATHFKRTGRGSGITAGNTSYKIDISSSAAKKAIKAYQKKTKAMKKAGKAMVNNVDSTSPKGGGNWWYNKRIQGMGKQVGDCTQASAMFEALCRHAGIECDIIENGLPVKNSLHHFWNVTKVDGVWYFCDARLENSIMKSTGRKKVKYSFLLKSKQTMAKRSQYRSIKNTKPNKKLYKLVSSSDYKKK